MLPSIFGENMFDDFFSDPFGMMGPQTRDALYGKHAKNLMKTDIRETGPPTAAASWSRWQSGCGTMASGPLSTAAGAAELSAPTA